MTRSEFDAKFNEKYKEALLSVGNPDILKARLEKVATENRKISNEDLCINMLLLSAEFSKNLIHSVLTDVLEFDE